VNFENSKKQGDWGMGQAIAYFTQAGCTVSVPITDSQHYDLIVDYPLTGLKKVEVKTTVYMRRKGRYFALNLRVFGGNRSGIQKARKLCESVDIVFAVTAAGTRYLIPVEHLGGTSTILLGPSYDRFQVGR